MATPSTPTPRRGTGATRRWDRSGDRPNDITDGITVARDPGTITLAAELAALDDAALAEQAALLAAVAAHPAIVPVIVVRLRLAAAELARRLAEREVRR